MNNRTYAGLIKFFRVESYLDELIAGKLYCNTPEFYRHSNLSGVGDAHESCWHSYRAARGDGQVRVTFGDKEIEGLTHITLHASGQKDMWLHCWCALDIPDDLAEFEALMADLARLRNEFGTHYAFVPGDRLKRFIEVVGGLAGEKFKPGLVTYSDNERSWSVGCKSTKYAYQREYRFAVGECDHTSKVPLVLIHSQGFADIIVKSPALKMWDKPSGVTCEFDHASSVLHRPAA